MDHLKEIILIDDDEATNFINKAIIKRSELDFNVQTFQTGYEGLEYLQSCLTSGKILPAVILLDINMPEMTGWEFLELFEKQSEQIRKSVKIYMLSSSQNEADVIRSQKYDYVFGYLYKPLSVHQLKEKL